MSLSIRLGDISDAQFAAEISELYKISSEERGTGIANRSPEYIRNKIITGNSIVCVSDGELAGFCYIETFSNQDYVSNSGLIVKPSFRGQGLSRKIKNAAVDLAQEKYPKAKIFGITTSEIVMKINSDLGYIPVPLHKLTSDDEFWKGCSSCKNYDILERNKRAMCLCTGMLLVNSEIEKDKKNKEKKS